MNFRFPIAALLAISASVTAAETITRADLEAWLQDDAVIDVPLAPGASFSGDEIERLSAVLPPGYRDELRFPGFSMEIQQTGDYPPYQPYIDATGRHANDTGIAEDGALTGHVAGLPFPPERIAQASARDGGYMVAWNNIFRWHYYGYRAKPVIIYYLRPSEAPASGGRPPGVGGGATIERSVDMWFHRVYLNRLAMLPDDDYTLGLSGSRGIHYKDFMEITAPFDVAGAKFIIERSLDPYEEDQVNSYLPTERRVRRLSAQERADTFMGTDYTFDDFEGFSGRVMDYEWTLVGERSILAVADSKHDRVRVYGPGSHAPDNRWQLRDCYVVLMTPRWSGHPYGAKYMFIDKQTWLVHVALIFDRDGQLWKILDPIWQYPEADLDPPSATSTVGRWIATIGIDRLKGTSTVSIGQQTDLPEMKPSKVRRLFDVSALNEGR